MPEGPLCKYCLQPIDPVFDHHVVINTPQELKQAEWILPMYTAKGTARASPSRFLKPLANPLDFEKVSKKGQTEDG